MWIPKGVTFIRGRRLFEARRLLEEIRYLNFLIFFDQQNFLLNDGILFLCLLIFFSKLVLLLVLISCFLLYFFPAVQNERDLCKTALKTVLRALWSFFCLYCWIWQAITQFYNLFSPFLHKVRWLLPNLVFDLIWPSLKTFSSMSFRGESAL